MQYLREPRYCLEDVILAQTTKKNITKILAEIEYQDLIFNKWGWKEKHQLDIALSINFNGSPGVGKTLVAEALANAFKRKILNVPAYKLRSKFRGVTEKNIVKAFEVATEHNAVLFFDEAEDFLRERVDNVSQSTDAAYNSERTVMLIQLSEYKGIIIFATNKITTYDPAIISRIRWKIQFDLPDEQARAKIWQIQFPAQLPLDKSVNFEQLAKDFEEVSGRDIKNAVFQAVVAAAMENLPEQEKRVKQLHLVDSITQIVESNKAASKKEIQLKSVKGKVAIPEEISEEE